MPSALLTLRVAPKSSTDAFVGWHGSALKIKVRAAPEDGKANAAVIALLAKSLDLPRSALTLERGLASRDKCIRIDGLDENALRTRLDTLLPK